MKTGAIVQLCCSAAAVLIYFCLWIYHLAYAGCYRDDTATYIMKLSAACGWISSAFVMFHSCFERRVTNRGVYGCIMFFVLAIVCFINITVGFMSLNCTCKCTTDAWSTKAVEELTIFGLSLAGSICQIIILLTASVAHK